MKVRVRDLNEHVVCGLCKGYLVSATLVTECLHAFCKSCIVQHIEHSTRCPTCNILIHESQPLNYIRTDPTLQEIANKLIPQLQKLEEKREEQFCRRRGLVCELAGRKREVPETERGNPGEEVNFHRDDRQIMVSLDQYSENGRRDVELKPLKKKYVRCSHLATVRHLKKLVRRKLNISDSFKIDITCNEQSLGADHTLQFIAMTKWRHRPQPVMLKFRKGIEWI